MSRIITRDRVVWAVTHASHWLLMYMAFVLMWGGAVNAMIFLVWVSLPLSMLLLFHGPRAQQKPGAIRSALDWGQGALMLGGLVFGGNLFTGAAWLAVMACIHVGGKPVAKEQKQ